MKLSLPKLDVGVWVSIATSGLAVLGSYYVAERTVQKEYQKQRELLAEERAQDIRQAGIDFNVYAGQYVASVLDNKGRPKATDELLANLRRQHTALSIALSGYKPTVRDAAEQYRMAIEHVNSQVEASPSVEHLRPFWESAASLLQARDIFIQSLEQSFES